MSLDSGCQWCYQIVTESELINSPHKRNSTVIRSSSEPQSQYGESSLIVWYILRTPRAS
mgnify:CR=1 FL=1